MLRKKALFPLFLIVILTVLFSCKSGAHLTGEKATVNSKSSLKKPYVLLISLDGFRWDYVERFKPPHLSNFIKNGVRAESLIPSFPSKTFPNHYTIATGMYPDTHGIIGNSFYDYQKKLIYSIGDREMVEDGTFYGGTPIWVQADRANMVSASYFFVGSEANIQNLRPTYFHRYDGSIKNDIRVAQTLKWLQLPPKKRPHIITMYFSDLDDTGHSFGPNNDEELQKTLFHLDTTLGTLFDGVKQSGLPINIIIVSDHGMAPLSTSNLIPTESIKNDQLFLTIDNGALLNIHPKNKDQTEAIFHQLKAKEAHFKVYKTNNTPGFEYTPKNKNWGAIQIIPDTNYYFSSQRGIDYRKQNAKTVVGVHGYHPENKEMHGIFYANGPAFKKGYTIPSVKNIHVFPLMCKILGLDIPSNIDGRLTELENILNKD